MVSDPDRRMMSQAIDYAFDHGLEPGMVGSPALPGDYRGPGYNPTAIANANKIDPTLRSLVMQRRQGHYSELTPEELSMLRGMLDRSLQGFDPTEPEGRVSFFNRQPKNALAVESSQEQLNALEGALAWTDAELAQVSPAQAVDSHRPALSSLESASEPALEPSVHDHDLSR